MTLDVNLPASSISDIGRQLRLTGDIVFSGAFSDAVPTSKTAAPALFFARLFSQMRDDGIGVFVEQKTFDATRLILDNSIYSSDGSVVGYVADEIVECRPDNTLFCAAVIEVDGMSGVRDLLQHYLLWPTLVAVDAKCSTCGRTYNARIPMLDWCLHVVDGKQPIANVRVSKLTLVTEKLRQLLPDMLKNAPGRTLDVDILGKVGDVVPRATVVDGPPDELRITFGIPRGTGVVTVEVGPHRLHPGESIDLPLSAAREWITAYMLDEGLVVPLTHSGTIRNLLPPAQAVEGGQP